MSKHVIDELGGPTKVAEMLGWGGIPGRVQRVSNWKKRGIPSLILLNHPQVFASVLGRTASPRAEAA